MNIITGVALGGFSVADIRMPCIHQDLKTQGTQSSSLAAILYHVVRCKLLHESVLPDEVKITTDGTIGGNGAPALIPHTIILGLLIAVISSGVNRAECMQHNIPMNFREICWDANQLWGKRPEIYKQLVEQWERMRNDMEKKS